ncbi:MAG: ATP-binding protein [Bifidobacteriaceae bacterium]|jgi:predicted AAA+ superfamily ATPase|nr:ATP-binding protein [Bifidobacteriaceae bacterium]
MNEQLDPLFRRHAAMLVEEALTDTPIVVIQGARQVGKSTLAKQIADGRRAVQVSLDDADALDFAQFDPAGFVAQGADQLLVVDEAQRAPQIILPLKAEVDRDRRPGRFLLTGSSDLLRVRGAGDSLAGRAETIRLFPLSQGEIARRAEPERFVATLAEAPNSVHGIGLQDLPERLAGGGFPEPLKRPTPRAQARWFDSYVERLASHDANEANRGRFARRFRGLLTVVAARGQSELNVARLARDSGIPETSLAEYLDLAESMYLLERLPAWGLDLLGRTIRRPKVGLVDTGLGAHLARFRPAQAGQVPGREAFGALLEQFVAGELRRQRSWSPTPYELYHYREDARREVDLVVELEDSTIIGVEVKATAHPGRAHLAQLEALRERVGGRLRRGVLLHTGRAVQHRDGWLSVLPVDSLWS